MQCKTQVFEGLEVSKVLHAKQNARVLWLWASEACACKAQHKGFTASRLSIRRMPKTSSKQAPKKFKGRLEGAQSKLEACLNQDELKEIGVKPEVSLR